MTRKIEPGETDCEFCQRMKREAPKLYRRMVRAALNPKPTRDLFLIQTGNRIGTEQFEKFGAEEMLRTLDRLGDDQVLKIEGELKTNLRLSRSDVDLISWCASHAIADLVKKHTSDE
jgi:hypothetical protein